MRKNILQSKVEHRYVLSTLQSRAKLSRVRAYCRAELVEVGMNILQSRVMQSRAKLRWVRAKLSRVEHVLQSRAEQRCVLSILQSKVEQSYGGY